MISALFVETKGVYFGLQGVIPWDITRDARNYCGPYPVVAHPPCNLWINLAALNWKRYQRVKPAWYPGGSDNGCFSSALYSVRKFCGVLEHPAMSWAWTHHGLQNPTRTVGWVRSQDRTNEWVCEVWQQAYGHKARKRTWLLYVGKHSPTPLNWRREAGTHQIGGFDKRKPIISRKEASRTPLPFALTLCMLARNSV